MSRIPVSYFPYDSQRDKTDWRSVLSEIDRSIVLSKHTPGSLAELAEDLHFLSGGAMGTLMRIIVGAAERAIDSEHEQITRDLLHGIAADVGATRDAWPEEFADEPAARPARPARKANKAFGCRSTRTINKGRGIGST